MTGSISLKSLHLEYRIWIAELNFDINLIRIFNDRLTELRTDHKTETETFDRKFNTCRDKIDGLRHRMHIEKMGLAAIARNNNVTAHYEIKIPENYTLIRDDFFAFRISFNDLKSEFLRFENK